MPARATFSTTVQFGVISFGVKAYTAARNSSPSLRLLHAACGSPINQVKKCTPCEIGELSADQIVKGSEISKGNFVRLSTEELASLVPESSKVMTVETFVVLDSVDPINYDKSYWLGPEDNKASTKSYVTLWRALQKTGKGALVQWVDHNHDKIGILRATYDGLIVQETFYADEIPSFEDQVGLDTQSLAYKQEEVALLEQLIDMSSGDFEKTRATFKDGAATRLRELVEAKSAGGPAPVFDLPTRKEATGDLAELLRAAIAAKQGPKKDLAKAESQKPAAVMAPAVAPEKKAAPKKSRRSA